MTDASADFAVRQAAATDADRNYMRSTLLQSFRRFGRGATDADRENYFAGHHDVVERLLARGAKLLIAHPKGQPDVIAGYALCEPRVLHYVLTKEVFRSRAGSPVGVATLLLKAVGPVDFWTHETVDWKSWLKTRYPLGKFSPYLLSWKYDREAREKERLAAAERSRVRVYRSSQEIKR